MEEKHVRSFLCNCSHTNPNPNPHTGHGISWQIALWELKKELLLYRKMANARKIIPTPWNWAAPYGKIRQRYSKTGFHWKQALSRFDRRSSVHVLSGITWFCHWKIDVWVLPALLQMLKLLKVSVLVLRPYFAHCVKLTAHPNRKPLLKMIHKNSPHIVKTGRLNTWIIGTLSCGLIKPRSNYLVQMVSSLCGSNQVTSTNKKWVLPTLKHDGQECHGLGLYMCHQHWWAKIHWGNHDWQHNEEVEDPIQEDSSGNLVSSGEFQGQKAVWTFSLRSVLCVLSYFNGTVHLQS